ncbi:MAG: YifB family Mg chelatase-like AAA ATPase [Treponemataceae bacterium]|nr:YifB family Mg chelatase-like AAA ATPase [Treponemataceae bacterium]
MKVVSYSPFGYEGSLVSVEVDLRRGIPAIDLVGLADNAVKESRERMRSAIINSGFEFPPERVLISLSPADVKKEGAGFDLAIALAVLDAKTSFAEESRSDNAVNLSFDDGILVMGELELSGKIRAVRGVHAAVSTACENGIQYCIVPKENELEARALSEMDVYGVENLVDAKKALEIIMEKNAVEIMTSCPGIEKSVRKAKETKEEPVLFGSVPAGLDFSDIAGQKKLVRALQIAAAGGHNCLVYGPPGCGKTLALERFPYLLPLLTEDEAREVTRIYSLAGILPRDRTLVREAPFRRPHQSASLEGIAGGGPHCMPGEISLAHNGVLFLDEAAEFRTSVLQTLRVPLENRRITLSRAGRHTTFPAKFQLMVATNPCPCGNYGSEDKLCLCSVRSVEQYWKKFSAPLLDRIDIRVNVSQEAGALVDAAETGRKTQYGSVSTGELRLDIGRAVETQRKRQGKANALLTPEEVDYYCKMDDTATKILSDAVSKNDFSARAVHSCIRLSRTIADMEGAYGINGKHMEEAVGLRNNEGAMGFCL